MTGDLRLEPATAGDMPTIAACVHRFRLDDEDLCAEQFVVALDDPPSEIAAKLERVCGRLRTGVIAMVLVKPA